MPSRTDLNTYCETYKIHLENEMVRLLKKDNPKLKDGNKKIRTVITEKKENCGLYGPPYQFHSNEFSLLKKKHNAVVSLQETLKTKKDDKGKIEDFRATLSKERETLEKQRDSAAKRFLKGVAHILSGGIVSKLSKGSFCFWKSHGKVFAEKVSGISSKATKGM